MTSTMHKSRTRAIVYWLSGLGLLAGFALLRDSAWQGNTHLHTVMETVATLLALMVGVLALLRFYSRRSNLYLFVGTAFLGTALLDGYHAIVTSWAFAAAFPSVLDHLVPWSWSASRTFLGAALLLSWFGQSREAKLGAVAILPERTVYLIALLLTLSCFAVFAVVPLPRAHYPGLLFSRPQELLAGVLFGCALIGFLHKGDWRDNDFEHWLVLSLVIGCVGSFAFMSTSAHLYDGMFDAAHLLKKASYVCVLAGLLISVFGLIRKADDIEQRAQLDYSQRQLTMVTGALDQSASLVLITDSQGRIEYANPRFCAVSGYPLEEVLGQTPALVKGDDAGADVHEDLWQTILAGDVWLGEFHNRARDGRRYWVSTTISPVRDGDGQVSHFIGIQEDISERKRKERLDAALSSLREQVWSMTAPGDVDELQNTLGEALTELKVPFVRFGTNLIEPNEEVTHHSSSGTVKATPSTQGLIRRVWQSGEPCLRSDLEEEDPYDERPGFATLSPPVRCVLDVPFSHGTLAVNSDAPNAFSDHHVTILKTVAGVMSEGWRRLDDLRALESKEQQLRQAQKMEAIGQLAGGVAHDFNNLITVIGGYAQMLERKLEDESMRDSVGQIRAAADSAASLVRQLLALSRRQVLQPVVLDVNATVAHLEKMLRRLIGENINFVTHLTAELHPVHADPGQLEQVIMNLVINARDAMPEGGHLSVETANIRLTGPYVEDEMTIDPGEYVLLVISDTGSGMDADAKAQAFDPFFTTKEMGRGTGLGLATVYGIIKQSGGYINIYSEVGHGTAVKIYLPRGGDKQMIVEPGRDLAPAQAPLTGTVLLVEDEELVRTFARDALEEGGMTVISAESGADALDVVSRHGDQVDMVLTDVIMPGMTGPELVVQLDKILPGVRTLFMSGYMDRDVVDSGALAADTPFLQKPFSPDDLLAKVRELLTSDREAPT